MAAAGAAKLICLDELAESAEELGISANWARHAAPLGLARLPKSPSGIAAVELEEFRARLHSTEFRLATSLMAVERPSQSVDGYDLASEDMQEQAVVSAPIGAGEGLVDLVVASMGALSSCSDDQNGRGSEQEPEDVPIRLDQVEGEFVAPAWDGDIGPLDAVLDGAAGGPTLGTGPAGEMGGPTVRELPRAVPRAAPGAPPRSLIVRRGVDVGLESLPAGPLRGKGGIEEYDADVSDDKVQLCVPIAHSREVHSPWASASAMHKSGGVGSP